MISFFLRDRNFCEETVYLGEMLPGRARDSFLEFPSFLFRRRIQISARGVNYENGRQRASSGTTVSD